MAMKGVKKGIIEKIASEIEEMELEPAPEDYIKTPCGSLGSKTCVGVAEGKFLGEFATEEEADKAICERMDKDQFWSTVWFLSDHGNLRIDEESDCFSLKDVGDIRRAMDSLEVGLDKMFPNYRQMEGVISRVKKAWERLPEDRKKKLRQSQVESEWMLEDHIKDYAEHIRAKKRRERLIRDYY